MPPGSFFTPLLQYKLDRLLIIELGWADIRLRAGFIPQSEGGIGAPVQDAIQCFADMWSVLKIGQVEQDHPVAAFCPVFQLIGIELAPEFGEPEGFAARQEHQVLSVTGTPVARQLPAFRAGVAGKSEDKQPSCCRCEQKKSKKLAHRLLLDQVVGQFAIASTRSGKTKITSTRTTWLINKWQFKRVNFL